MNVLLIAIDTLRRDHMSCYGYPRLTTPHIDRLAAGGVQFMDSFSPFIPTHPGFTTLFTGVDVMEHQIVTQGGKLDLDPAIPMLAEVLQANGYRTGAADNLRRWFSRGFDRYEGYSFLGPVDRPWRKAEAVNEKALALLRDLAGEPFFLFVHYWDPHTPYLPPPPFDRMFYAGNESDPANKSMEKIFDWPAFREYFEQWMGHVTDVDYVIAAYDAEIAYADAAVAQLLTALDESGQADETLVVLTSDHGEILDEHPGYFDHHGLYDANLAVPLIMRLPGTLPSGLRVRGTVTLQDVSPTILDILGVAPDVPMTGRSLLAAATGRSRIAADELLLTECTWERKRGIRRHGWKLIEALEPDPHGGPDVELYDLRSDPAEQRNLARQRPEVVSELRSRLHRAVARRLRQTRKPDPIEVQGITLRRIGEIATAVPDNQKLG